MQQSPLIPCRLAYRKIQAHCAVRTSTRVGAQLRAIVGGKTGDITAVTAASLQTKFADRDYIEALRLLELANRIKAKHSKGGYQGGESES